jgi:uncharacterized repeat protein (TIGR03803 family)
MNDPHVGIQEIPSSTNTCRKAKLAEMSLDAMRQKFLQSILSLFLIACCGLVAVPARAQTEVPIHNFNGSKDGALPISGLIPSGPKGTQLFGTTPYGGSFDLGEVYRLTPPAKGKTAWGKTTVYNFNPAEGDGMSFGAVVADSDGNLYGGDGSRIFKIAPPTKEKPGWTETVIYTFTGGSDGSRVSGGLTIDSNGVLYGSTMDGGVGFGSIFSLEPPAGGQTVWSKGTLCSFGGGTDGDGPNGNLIIDSTGAVLGTTYTGGLYGFGTVFVLTPPHKFQLNWTKATIYSFALGEDGGYPNGGLIGGTGQVFGTTVFGGAGFPCCGVVYELVQELAGNPVYTFIVLHTFTGGTDGETPMAGLFLDASDAMWGTTAYGGSSSGVVFKFTPNLRVVPRTWTYSIFYEFAGKPDGAFPMSPLVQDSTGALYGTTEIDGKFGAGTVYKITP